METDIQSKQRKERSIIVKVSQEEFETIKKVADYEMRPKSQLLRKLALDRAKEVLQNG